ncbi:MAG: hypothetical protein AB8H47_26735 [Bacteroidia bacterium]
MPELTFLTVADFRIQDPTTAFTDLILTAQCFWYAWKLRENRLQNNILKYFWMYFALMGIASLFGGILGHGIYYMVHPRWKLLGHAFIGSAVFCLQKSTLESLKERIQPKWKRIFDIAILTQLIIFLSVLIFSEEIHFNAVRNQSAIGLVAMVLPFHIWGNMLDARPGRKWVIGAILWSLVPAIVYSIEFSFSKWFNYYDIGHVLLMVTFHFFYRSAQAFGKAEQLKDSADLVSA